MGTLFVSNKFPQLRVQGVGKFVDGLLVASTPDQVHRLLRLAHLGVHPDAPLPAPAKKPRKPEPVVDNEPEVDVEEPVVDNDTDVDEPFIDPDQYAIDDEPVTPPAHLEAPNRGASRADWAEYAEQMGVDPTGLKRGEIMVLLDTRTEGS